MKLDLLTNATVVNDAVRGFWCSSILADNIWSRLSLVALSYNDILI